jgi:hypothetical protein
MREQKSDGTDEYAKFRADERGRICRTRTQGEKEEGNAITQHISARAQFS